MLQCLPRRIISLNRLFKPANSAQAYNVFKMPHLYCKNVILNQRTFVSSLKMQSVYEHQQTQKLGKIEPKLFIAFTCKVCKTRLEKHISKIAYTKGVVIITCDGCKENHLIADNLGWFPNLKSMRNIEDIMAAKGETVQKTLPENTFKIKEE